MRKSSTRTVRVLISSIHQISGGRNHDGNLPPDMKERKDLIRRDLLNRDGRGCQAETHESNCPCQGCRGSCARCKNVNIDHFTAKAVARELGWSNNQIERLSNKQLLSIECHRAKDAPTPDMAGELRQQRKGRFIGFGEHAGIIYET